jgi:protein disulfide-isomerase
MLRGQKGGDMRKTKVMGVLILATVVLLGVQQEAVASKRMWTEDYDSALTQAAKENKYVLVDFSGSDWCGWCIKLDEEVFSERKFEKYAKENLILVMVDFPRESNQSAEQTAANKALAKKHGVRGYPTVLILNPKGEVVKRTGYQQGGPEAYVKMIKDAIAK